MKARPNLHRSQKLTWRSSIRFCDDIPATEVRSDGMISPDAEGGRGRIRMTVVGFGLNKIGTTTLGMRIKHFGLRHNTCRAKPQTHSSA